MLIQVYLADLASALPQDSSVTVIGACHPDVARGMRQLCPDYARLRIQGISTAGAVAGEQTAGYPSVREPLFNAELLQQLTAAL